MMSNDPQILTMVEQANQFGKQLAQVEFIQRYQKIEEQVENHLRIQELLQQLKKADARSYQTIYDQLMSIPLFSEYIDSQEQVEAFLKNILGTIIKGISPKISLQEKSKGGCSHCSGC